jgi:hypothetical protein
MRFSFFTDILEKFEEYRSVSYLYWKRNGYRNTC